MDVTGYLDRVRHRAELLRRLRAVLSFTNYFLGLLLIPLALRLYLDLSWSLLALGIVSALLIAVKVCRGNLKRTAVDFSTIALLLDATLETRGRVVSFTELVKQNSADGNQSTLNYIEKQLREIDVSVSPAEIVPYRLTRTEWFRILLALLLAILFLFAGYRELFRIKLSDPLAEKLREHAEDENLPPEVKEALEDLAEQLESTPNDREEIQEQVRQAEEKISAAREAASQSAKEIASLDKQLDEEKSSLQETPTPTATPEKSTESQESSGQEQSESSSPDQSGEQGQEQQKDQQDKSESENQQGKEGEKGEKGQKNPDQKSSQGGKQESQQQGEGQGESPSEEKSESKNGQGKGESKEDGKQGEGESEGQGKESGDAGQESSAESGESGNDPKQQALDQAQKALDEVKKEKGAEPKSEGESPSPESKKEGQQPQQGKGDSKEGKEPGQAPKDGVEQKRDSDSQTPQSGEQPGKEADKPADKKEPGDAKSSSPGAQQEDSKGKDDTTSPADKSSLPDRPGETQEYKEGDGKDWDGPEGKVEFKDKRIDNNNEALDSRYTGAVVGMREGEAPPAALGAVVPRPLGKPDSITDSAKQPVPLEYRDIID